MLRGSTAQPDAAVLRDVHFNESSIAQSFVDKSFDQLKEVCSLCGWMIEAYQPRGGTGGVTVSLFKNCEDVTATSAISVEEGDAAIAAAEEELRARCAAGAWSIEQAVQHVVQSAGALWSNMLGLSTLAPADPMMAQLAGGGGMGMGGGGGDFNPEMFKMMLKSSASAAAPAGPTDDEAALKRILTSIRVVLREPAEVGRSSTATFHDDTLELSVSLPSVAAPSAQFYGGVAIALDAAVRTWSAATIQSTTSGDAKFTLPRRGTDEVMPPMLLLAGVISADRKQRSSQLRFPRPLLEQVLWQLNDGSSSPGSSDDKSRVQIDFERHAVHRLDVEFPQPVDEDPLEEESDEEYFARIRPKTYLDLCASYLPSRKRM